MKKSIYRIIDANFNRSREGLRVCEDITRFILNSKALTNDLRGIRHRISKRIKEFVPFQENLVKYRDALTDVGSNPRKINDQLKRGNYSDIFAANIERVKESLRVLEEFSKFFDSKISVKFSRLRFNVYDIEKRAVKALSSLRYTG